MLARLLFQLLADALALEAGQIIHEQLAVQVIDLVLDAHRQQAIGIQLEGLAVAVQGAHLDALGALNLLEEARHRQAAFLHFLDAVPLQYLGIDEK
jgi:hypothetical protein